MRTRVAKRNGQRPAGAAAQAQAIPDKALRDQIRTWAHKNGHPVAERGFIPKAVAEAFRAAHGGR